MKSIRRVPVRVFSTFLNALLFATILFSCRKESDTPPSPSATTSLTV